MTTPKGHHYVPRFLLDRFVSNDRQLWIVRKLEDGPKLFRAAPEAAFKQTHLNSFRNSDGSKDPKLEHWYSTLEADAAPVVAQIVDSVLDGREPGLAEDQRRCWNQFFYQQRKRAPDSYAHLGLEQDLRRDIARAISELEQNDTGIPLEERELARSNDGIKRVAHNAALLARADPGEAVMRALEQRGMAFAFVERRDKCFVIGDRVPATLGPGGILNPGTEMWLPIAPRVAVSPYGKPFSERIVKFTAGQIRKVNAQIYAESNMTAANNEHVLRTLAGISQRKRVTSGQRNR